MVKKILISQPKPTSEKSPYYDIERRHDVELVFRPFIKVESITPKEFRQQRISILDHTAIVFSSRHAIDAYFKMCDEMRFKVPETMKYFCTTELVALYLQKHVVYRKRKIFFGDGSVQSIVAQIGPKHKGEKFLITTSAEANTDQVRSLFEKAGLDFTVSVMVKSVPQDLSSINLADYGALVLYNPYDLKSLKASFPEFEQGSLSFITYGKSIAKALEEEGLKIAVKGGPNTDIPSASKAIDVFLGGE